MRFVQEPNQRRKLWKCNYYWLYRRTYRVPVGSGRAGSSHSAIETADRVNKMHTKRRSLLPIKKNGCRFGNLDELYAEGAAQKMHSQDKRCLSILL